MTDIALHAVWTDQECARASFLNRIAPWCKQQWQSGRSLEVEVRLHQDAKTDRQRRYYHGVVLKSIAEQARPNGQQFPLAVWKEHFRAEFLGFKTVTAIKQLSARQPARVDVRLSARLGQAQSTETDQHTSRPERVGALKLSRAKPGR